MTSAKVGNPPRERPEACTRIPHTVGYRERRGRWNMPLPHSNAPLHPRAPLQEL